MLVQAQVVFDELKQFKLVVRIHTDNETPLIHTQVIELDEDLNRSFIKLLYPNMLDFDGVTATASAEVITKSLAEQEAKAAELKAAEEAKEKELEILEPKEVVVEA